jgi:hypothetical protein
VPPTILATIVLPSWIFLKCVCAVMLLLLQVVSGLSSLEELALGSTRISGSLTCDLPASLKVRPGGGVAVLRCMHRSAWHYV